MDNEQLTMDDVVPDRQYFRHSFLPFPSAFSLFPFPLLHFLKLLQVFLKPHTRTLYSTLKQRKCKPESISQK